MAIAEISAPGTVITSFKSRGMLKGSDSTKRTIVGSPKAGIVPVGVRELGDASNRFYTAVSLSNLEALSGEKGTKVEPNQDITIQERNIIKLWDCDLFWDTKSDKPTLKEGVSVWGEFDNDEQLINLTLEKPEDKSPGLAFSDSKSTELKPGQVKFPPLEFIVKDGSLMFSMNRKVPPTIYYQLQVFNWVSMELGQKLGKQ